MKQEKESLPVCFRLTEKRMRKSGDVYSEEQKRGNLSLQFLNKESSGNAKISRKSLVNVGEEFLDEDLLNNSYLQQEDMEGLVFLETETQFYILTYEEELENLQELQVTLQMVRQCRERYAGRCRFRICSCNCEKKSLNDSTREGIVVSDLTDTKKLGQSDIVIVIGKSCR